MKQSSDKTLKGIFELKSQFENVFFRYFENTLSLPVKLNHTHFKTMIVLYFEGESPMSDISHRLNLEKGSFTTVANTLIKLGYIEKKQSLLDRRVYNIKLTPSGETFAKAFKKNHHEFITTCLKKLTPEEQDAYLDALTTLNRLTQKIKDLS
jgi:DNA-binding MarR family transcriptional regulator